MSDLNSYSKSISKCIEKGNQVLNGLSEDKAIGDHSLPAVLFLRNYLEIIDSISILVKNSSIDPCKILLRSCFETLLQIEFLVQSDTQRRSNYYLVWHTFKMLNSAKKLLAGSKEREILFSRLKNDRYSNFEGSIAEYDQNKLQNYIDERIAYLKKPELADIAGEYRKLKNKNKNKNFPWYSLFNGPQTTYHLAELVGFTGIYEVIYRFFSGYTHGSEVLLNKLTTDAKGKANIIRLRYPIDAASITTYAILFSIIVLRDFTEYYAKELRNDILEWYFNIKSELDILIKGN